MKNYIAGIVLGLGLASSSYAEVLVVEGQGLDGQTPNKEASVFRGEEFSNAPVDQLLAGVDNMTPGSFESGTSGERTQVSTARNGITVAKRGPRSQREMRERAMELSAIKYISTSNRYDNVIAFP